MEFPRSVLMAHLSQNEINLSKLNKDVLYPNVKAGVYNEPPDPDQSVTLTWEQLNRFLSLYQNLLTTLQYAEQHRLDNLSDKYMKAL
jgi:hypothetical protein